MTLCPEGLVQFEVVALAVEPQQVIPGQTESADGGFDLIVPTANQARAYW